MNLQRYDFILCDSIFFLHCCSSNISIFHANARVSGLVSISRTLRAKADVGDAAKIKMEKLQVAHKAFNEAMEK